MRTVLAMVLFAVSWLIYYPFLKSMINRYEEEQATFTLKV